MSDAPPQSARQIDRRFFIAATIVTIVLVFAGFARSYYLMEFTGAPDLAPHVHVHGVVMSLWFVLFLVQVLLVAFRRTPLHRKVGVVGTVLAVVMVSLGVATALSSAHRTRSDPAELAFLVVSLGDILTFGTFVALGIALRRRTDVHKRLMLLASMSILPAAIGRIPLSFIENGGALAFYGLTDVVVVAALVVDAIRNRRVHPAFLWGTVVYVVSQPVRLWIGTTGTWMRIAEWLAS